MARTHSSFAPKTLVSTPEDTLLRLLAEAQASPMTRAQALRTHVKNELKIISERERDTKEIQVELLDSLEFNGTEDEVLVKKGMCVTLTSLRRWKDYLTHTYHIICMDAYLFHDSVVEELFTSNIEKHELPKQIREVMSFVPFYITPISLFLDIDSHYQAFQQKERGEFNFSTKISSAIVKLVFSQIETARRIVIERLEGLMAIRETAQLICQRSEFIPALQKQWLLEIIDELMEKAPKHAKLIAQANPGLEAQVQLEYAIMKAALDNPQFDFTADFNHLMAEALSTLSPNHLKVIEDQKLVPCLRDSVCAAFTQAIQKTESEYKNTEPESPKPSENKAPDANSLQNAKQYFKSFQNNPSPACTEVCNNIRGILFNLKSAAHKLNNDAALFEFIKQQNKALDDETKEFKHWVKTANATVQKFNETKDPLWQGEHIHTCKMIEARKANIQRIEGTVVAKQIEIEPRLKSLSPSNSSSSSQNGLFGPAESKTHLDLVNLSAFNAFKIPQEIEADEEDMLKQIQIYAALHEIITFVEKQEKFDLKTLCGLERDAIMTFKNDLLAIRVLLDALSNRDRSRVNSLYEIFIDFSRKFAEAVNTNKPKNLLKLDFYKHLIKKAAILVKNNEPLSNEDSRHYCMSLSYTEMVFPKDLTLPNGMRECAFSLMKEHKLLLKEMRKIALRK